MVDAFSREDTVRPSEGQKTSSVPIIDGRVLQFFHETGIGCGDDPIGFLLLSHREMARQRDELRDKLNALLQPSPVDTYLSDLEKGLVSISDDGFTSRKIIATIKDRAAQKNMGDKE